jgi:hypothetical protein
MSGTEAAAAIAEVNQQAGGAKPIRPSKDLFQVRGAGAGGAVQGPAPQLRCSRAAGAQRCAVTLEVVGTQLSPARALPLPPPRRRRAPT